MDKSNTGWQPGNKELEGLRVDIWRTKKGKEEERFARTNQASEIEWHIRVHGAFEINHEIRGIKLPTRVATTRHGFISCMSTHDWLIAHLEMGNIGGQSSGKETVRTTTGRTTWPSTQKNHVAIPMRPPRCSASESHECGKLFRRPCAGIRGSLFSPVCLSRLVTRPHPLIAHMSHEVQGHRPALPKRVFFFFEKTKKTLQDKKRSSKHNERCGVGTASTTRRKLLKQFQVGNAPWAAAIRARSRSLRRT